MAVNRPQKPIKNGVLPVRRTPFSKVAS